MDAASLESLQHSFGNLRVNNANVDINGNAPSSSLPWNGSLTGVFPSLESSDRVSTLGSSNTSTLLPSFNLAQTLMGGYGFGEPDPYFLAPTTWNDPLQQNHFSFFSIENPFLHPNPEAIAAGENLLKNGFNMGNDESCVGFLQGNKDRIITLAMLEESSKHLQSLILINDPRITKLIFEGVIDNIFQLMTSQYGRYLFQKILELKEQDMLQRIVEKLTLSDKSIIYNASIDRYGSFSVKKLIKVLQKSPLVSEVVKSLASSFWDLMINQTGQYVIMECLDVLDSQRNDLLYIEAIDKCLKLATDERGFGALNNFIVRIKGPRRDQLLEQICEQVVFLSQHPDGNFVVQCVLGLQNPAFIQKICYKLRGYYVKLSTQKGGSHLVEECLKSSGLVHVVQEFLQSNQLVQLAKNRYGNYVLQAALKEAKKTSGLLHKSLVMKLRSCHNLKDLNHGYGRNILSLIAAPTLPLNKA
ncbi:hypothetical protein CCACVL1_05786 [Corchorus capsularis]|uniref:PUM-HD domain-containing protein n=1 Tax=Corchorus capsularis TaxID=210143 RepID=A0A1R3JJ78_COCAP|nr:hypothetical protein CCACVL1_05786 [Corchorus capsularis]